MTQQLDQNFATVGELVDHLLKMDRNTPLVRKPSMGAFQIGVSVRIAPAAKNKADPEYIGDLTSKVWKSKADLFETPFDVLVIEE